MLESEYNPKKFIVVLAAGKSWTGSLFVIASNMKKKYGKRFGHFLVTVHPDGMKEKLPGKGSNIAYAEGKN